MSDCDISKMDEMMSQPYDIEVHLQTVQKAYNTATHDLTEARAEIARLREKLAVGDLDSLLGPDSSAQDASNPSVERPVCQHCGKTEQEHFGYWQYCDTRYQDGKRFTHVAHAPMVYETFVLLKQAVESQCKATASVTAERDQLRAELETSETKRKETAKDFELAFRLVRQERDQLKAEAERLECKEREYLATMRGLDCVLEASLPFVEDKVDGAPDAHLSAKFANALVADLHGARRQIASHNPESKPVCGCYALNRRNAELTALNDTLYHELNNVWKPTAAMNEQYARSFEQERDTVTIERNHLKDENERIVSDAKQAHIRNDGLVQEHLQLKAENEKLQTKLSTAERFINAQTLDIEALQQRAKDETEKLRAVLEEALTHLRKYQTRYHEAPHAKKPWEECAETELKGKQP